MLTLTWCRLVLKNVHHVLEVRLNLLPFGPLDDEGYGGNIWNDALKFCKGSLIVAQAQKTIEDNLILRMKNVQLDKCTNCLVGK